MLATSLGQVSDDWLPYPSPDVEHEWGLDSQASRLAATDSAEPLRQVHVWFVSLFLDLLCGTTPKD